jgi:dienelactone hydrolase
MRRVLSIILLALLVVAGCRRPARSRPSPAVRAERIVRDLAAGRFARVHAALDQPSRAAVDPKRLDEAWAEILRNAGPFVAIERVERTSERAFVVHARHARHAVDVEVAFDRAAAVSRLWLAPSKVPWSAPPYARSEAFEERPFEVGADPALPGTLTLPRGIERPPAVVLVHGSGPSDRDESLAAVKPFRDLAWGLASRGIAVLRYEKRTRFAPQSLPPVYDLDDEAGHDAKAAIAALAKDPAVDGRRIVVVGHSQGGSLAPRIARGTVAAGVVVLAGSTRPFDRILVEQTAYLLGIRQVPEPDRSIALEHLRDELRRIRAPGPREEILVLQGASIPRSWFQDQLAHRGEEVAQTLAIPIFVAQGGRDYQVTLEDFAGWERALAGRARVTLRVYPELDHLFVSGEGRSTPDDYGWPGHVAAEVVDDLAKFVATLPSAT